jgi:hypothetical protein
MKLWIEFSFLLSLVSVATISCSHIKTAREDQIGKEVDQELAASTDPAKAKPAKIVSPNDLATLEKMNRALEDYIHRKDSKELLKLCKDLRFDCYLDNKIYPKTRKLVKRNIQPYATGSKMGLHGENRIQIRYEFFPK